ncbi:LOW QUALITY PROTEIN: hypothetical protein ACHAXS_004760 [Conticribra weissflogii]
MQHLRHLSKRFSTAMDENEARSVDSPAKKANVTSSDYSDIYFVPVGSTPDLTECSTKDEDYDYESYQKIKIGSGDVDRILEKSTGTVDASSEELVIESIRSRYRFQPIRMDPKRPVSPALSEYDDEYYQYGEESGCNSSDDENDPRAGIDENREEIEQIGFSAVEKHDLSSTVKKDKPLQRTKTTKTAPSRKFKPKITPSFMEPPKIKSLVKQKDDATNEHRIPTEASNGSSVTDQLTMLTHQLDHVESQIYKLNNSVEFNINSPKQVALVLFGEECSNESTNKDVLEAMASAGNEMAACIFKFRKLSRDYKRELKRVEQQKRGDKKNDYYGNLAKLHAAEANKQSGILVDDHRAHEDKTIETNASFQVYQTVRDEESPEPVAQRLSVDGAQIKQHRPRREPLLLIDASAYIFRSYYAIPPLHRSDGTPTGALHGFCRMLQNLLLKRLLKGDRPRVVLAFDSGGPNFRHDIYPDYKANRGPCPEDLIPQFALVREAAEAFGVVQVEASGFEADDVIATLARKALVEGVDVDILSGDKDLMQLITPHRRNQRPWNRVKSTDLLTISNIPPRCNLCRGQEPCLHMVDPVHFDRVSHDDVIQKWGVSSDKLGDLLALAGDSSDNIPGVPGIGPKTAALLINEYGSLIKIIEQAHKIKQKKRRESILENSNNVILFRQLVALNDKVPMDLIGLPPSYESVSNLRMSSFDPNRLIDFYNRMELNACKEQLQQRLRANWVDFKAPPTPSEYDGVPF